MVMARSGPLGQLFSTRVLCSLCNFSLKSRCLRAREVLESLKLAEVIQRINNDKQRRDPKPMSFAGFCGERWEIARFVLVSYGFMEFTDSPVFLIASKLLKTWYMASPAAHPIESNPQNGADERSRGNDQQQHPQKELAQDQSDNHRDQQKDQPKERRDPKETRVEERRRKMNAYGSHGGVPWSHGFLGAQFEILSTCQSKKKGSKRMNRLLLVGSKYIFREFAKLENIIINLSDQQTCGTWFQRRTEQRPKEKIKNI